jgi:hypothetical protein
MNPEEERARTTRILARLAEETTAGHVTWRPARPRIQTAFAADLASGYSVQILSQDDDDRPPFRFSLHDAEGTQVQSVSSLPLQGLDVGDRNRANELNRYLSSLYFAARDQVLGIGQALSQVEKDLGLS